MYISIQLIHFVVQQKLTQLRKAIILQNLKKNNGVVIAAYTGKKELKPLSLRSSCVTEGTPDFMDLRCSPFSTITIPL